MEWEYTRTRRKHYINDGEVYGDGNHWYLWEISSSAPYGFMQGKHGYDLHHKAEFVKHGKTVKELKAYVAEQALTTQKQGSNSETGTP